jgi:hypothetical protein
MGYSQFRKDSLKSQDTGDRVKLGNLVGCGAFEMAIRPERLGVQGGEGKKGGVVFGRDV